MASSTGSPSTPRRRSLLTDAVAVAGVAALGAYVAWAVHRRARRRRSCRVSVKVDSAYARSAVQEAAANLGLVLDAAAPCAWADFSAHRWEEIISGKDVRWRASCLYVRSGLVRKALLAHYLQKRRARAAKTGGPAPPEVLPHGFVVDVEDEEDLETLRGRLAEAASRQPPVSAEGPVWVAKASTSNRGENLFICRTADEVVEAVRPVAMGAGVVEWVVQRYVSPPVLLLGRKFHVRAHLLVSGCPLCGTSRAWLHREHHVLLLASVGYSSMCTDRMAHITNHCLQADQVGYDEDRQVFAFMDLDRLLGRAGVAAGVQARMEEALCEALAAAASARAGFAPLPQCFELYGVDFTLEDRGAGEPPGVWLLEVNSGPDLAVFGARLRPRCVDLVRDVLRAAVEPFLAADAPAMPFPARACDCVCDGSARAAGFSQCLWSAAPSAASPEAELEVLRRRLSIAGGWARALHEGSGIAIRGPQAAAAEVDR